MARRVHSSPSSPEPATNFTYLSFKSELRDSRLKLPDTDEDKTNGGERISRIPKHLCAKLQYLLHGKFSETRYLTQRRLHIKVSYGLT